MEAHASDEWPLGTKTQIPQHKTIEDRITAAKNFQKENEWTLPLVVDTIENDFHNAVAAWPERLLILKDGKVEYIQIVSDDGFDPLWTEQVEQWLKKGN